MTISPQQKRALRRVGADRRLTKTQLANELGITRMTLRLIINNDEPQEIRSATYQKIADLIAEHY